MRRSPPDFSARSAQMPGSISKSDPSSIASISASSMISTPSSAPSVSKRHNKTAKREQNPHYSHYNGLTAAKWGTRRQARKLGQGYESESLRREDDQNHRQDRE